MKTQNYRKTFTPSSLYPAFLVIAAIALLAMPNYIVRSQDRPDARPSPFKFNRPPERKENIFSPASAGDLDPMFGTGGKSTIDFGSSEYAYAVAVQADGKIVAAGSVAVGGTANTNYDFAVFRYNADGSLDTSFDADGKLIRRSAMSIIIPTLLTPSLFKRTAKLSPPEKAAIILVADLPSSDITRTARSTLHSARAAK